jgi:peptidoglycan/LPS O-acetylase OafA/YrhL
MRFIKIVLIIFSTIILGGMLYLLLENFSDNRLLGFSLFFVYSGLTILFSLVNILYHIKTFRFYRRKEKRNLDKKVSNILWVGAICFSSFLLFRMGSSFYSYAQIAYDREDIFFTFIFIALLLIGLLEVFLLKKRIKRLKDERTTKDEINSIGNITL